MRGTSVVSIVIVVAIMLFAMVLGTIYVYSDAKKRNMKAVKWAIIAFFYPLLTGIAAYMICRKPLIDLKCPKCESSLVGDEKVCPGCKTVLLTQCPQCGFPVERGWKTCPQCGNSYETEFVRPLHMYRKDRGHIVTIIIVGILIVAGIILINLTAYSTSNSAGMIVDGMGNITASDLSKNETIAKWIKESDESGEDAYILKQENGDTCIMYAPNSDSLMEVSAYLEVYDNGHSEVRFSCYESDYEDVYGYDFFIFELDVDGEMEFDKKMDSGNMKIKVTTTDEDISQSTWRESNVGK